MTAWAMSAWAGLVGAARSVGVVVGSVDVGLGPIVVVPAVTGLTVVPVGITGSIVGAGAIVGMPGVITVGIIAQPVGAGKAAVGIVGVPRLR